jgi:hypothetical protein
MQEPPDPSRPADAFREFIAETAQRAAAYADLASRYAELRDDAGLVRAVRLMAVCAGKAAETLPMLKAAEDRDRALREAARAVAANARPTR